MCYYKSMERNKLLDLDQTLNAIAELPEHPSGTKIAVKGTSVIFLEPPNATKEVVGLEKITLTLKEASNRFKSQLIDPELYENVCKGLLKLDEALNYDNETVHSLGMSVFYDLLEAYQQQHKKMSVFFPPRFHSLKKMFGKQKHPRINGEKIK